jgi:hypothetical protein
MYHLENGNSIPHRIADPSIANRDPVEKPRGVSWVAWIAAARQIRRIG